MKLTTLTTDELELTEGSAAGVVVGAVFVVAAACVAYFFRSANPYMIWVALGIGVIGIVVVLFSSSITVNFSKSTGQLRYQKKRLVGAENATYAIADVFRIETRKQWRVEPAPSSGDQPPAQQPTLVAQSVIVFKDGRELALDHQKTSSTTSVGSAVLMSGQGGESALAARVATFLNVPFQEIAPPNMGAGINIISGPRV